MTVVGLLEGWEAGMGVKVGFWTQCRLHKLNEMLPYLTLSFSSLVFSRPLLLLSVDRDVGSVGVF